MLGRGTGHRDGEGCGREKKEKLVSPRAIVWRLPARLPAIYCQPCEQYVSAWEPRWRGGRDEGERRGWCHPAPGWGWDKTRLIERQRQPVSLLPLWPTTLHPPPLSLSIERHQQLLLLLVRACLRLHYYWILLILNASTLADYNERLNCFACQCFWRLQLKFLQNNVIFRYYYASFRLYNSISVNNVIILFRMCASVYCNTLQRYSKSQAFNLFN